MPDRQPENIEIFEGIPFLMDLAEAWRVLGRDPIKVFKTLGEAGGADERVRAAEKALTKARVLAKKLHAAHHPDRNPNDNNCVREFQRVSEALETLEHHTTALRMKYDAMKLRTESPPDGFIQITK